MDTSLVRAEIDLKAIAHNVRELRRITHPDARLMGVVKANGYGHGAIEVARCALQNGAERLGVARIDEGIELREAGIKAPILIFGHTLPELAPELLEYDLTQTVYTPDFARALSRSAVSIDKKITIHLKVDSGMGRLGLLLQNFKSHYSNQMINTAAVDETLAIAGLKGLELEGIFTHFATADSEDKRYAENQLDLFLNYLNRVRKAGLNPAVKHAANSAALIDMPQAHLDMVRPGIAIYGLYPSDKVNKRRVSLRRAMTLRTKVIQLKKVPAGFNISYGMTYKTPKPTTIATVSIGYADGLNRLLSSQGQMLVHGKRVPIVGRICMDLTMLDVGSIENVQVGDEAVVFGKQGNKWLTVDEMASSLNTISYEIVSTITARVPRAYLK
ncbi:MAG: alanine racemase [Desulfobacterales bacterium]